MPQAIPVAAGVLSGPLGGVVSGIVGDIAKNALGGVGDMAKGLGEVGGALIGAPAQLLGGAVDNLKKLFCHKKKHKRHHHHCHHRPPCFSQNTTNNTTNNTYNININTLNNPAGQLRGCGPQIQNFIQNINQVLQQFGFGGIGGFGGGANASASASAGANASAGNFGVGGSSSAGTSAGAGASSGIDGKQYGGDIDAMMKDANSMLNSDDMKTQLKGQELMQKALRLFEMMSKLIEKKSEMEGKAIAAIR